MINNVCNHAHGHLFCPSRTLSRMSPLVSHDTDQPIILLVN